MKSIAYFLILTVAGVAQTDTIRSLEWLSGLWVNETGATRIEESWSTASGNSYIGWSRTVENDQLKFYEFMIIRRNTEGRLAFLAKPSGQEGGEFPLVEMRHGYVAFGNNAHDFPQKISYRLSGSDSLIGRIEGTVRGKFRAVDFPYRRRNPH